MATNKDDEQELLRQKRELLKLKQGIIEESDIIEIDEPQDIPELHGWKKVENFFYHNKWYVIVGALAALFIGYITFDTLSKEKNDLYVLAISTQNASGIYAKQVDIEHALERYCPDFDGNGYVHVGVNFINLSYENGVTEYSDSEHYKFDAEIFTGDSQLYLTDSGITAIINEMADGEIEYFMNMTEKYPDAVLIDDSGLQLNQTGFIDEARWTSCPDIVGVYVRDVFANMTGNDEDAQEQRRRALEVYDNIVNNNVVNPEK